jgi:excisionase family DNA binding protein
MSRLLTAQEVAELLNLSVDTVWCYTRQKRIPVVELGEKQYRYEKEAVLRALNGTNPATINEQARNPPEENWLVKEESPVYAQQGGYTYEDYVRIPAEPGYRFEVLGGMLFREPSPTRHHQRVTAALFRQLADFFDSFDPEGELYFAPLDVTLTDSNVLQPDILFISGSRMSTMREERVDGPCDLVVEVISPSNHRKDRLRKMEIYRKGGIPHYWIVDPEEDILEAYVLREDGYYALMAGGGLEDSFSHRDFPGLELDLAKVFYRPGHNKQDEKQD